MFKLEHLLFYYYNSEFALNRIIFLVRNPFKVVQSVYGEKKYILTSPFYNFHSLYDIFWLFLYVLGCLELSFDFLRLMLMSYTISVVFLNYFVIRSELYSETDLCGTMTYKGDHPPPLLRNFLVAGNLRGWWRVFVIRKRPLFPPWIVKCFFFLRTVIWKHSREPWIAFFPMRITFWLLLFLAKSDCK